jgi:hypothetical protein
MNLSTDTDKDRDTDMSMCMVMSIAVSVSVTISKLMFIYMIFIMLCLMQLSTLISFLLADISNANLLPEKSMDYFQSYIIKTQDITFGACYPEVGPFIFYFGPFSKPNRLKIQ